MLQYANNGSFNGFCVASDAQSLCSQRAVFFSGVVVSMPDGSICGAPTFLSRITAWKLFGQVSLARGVTNLLNGLSMRLAGR